MTTYSDALRELAEPRPVGDSIKVAILRAARAVGIPYARTFNIWYERARRIDAHEAAQIAEALEKKRDADARNTIDDLRTRLLMVESRIAAERANSNRPPLSHVRPSVSRRGDMDSAMAVVQTQSRGGRGR